MNQPDPKKTVRSAITYNINNYHTYENKDCTRNNVMTENTF